MTHQGRAQQRGRGQVPSGNQEHWQPSASAQWWETDGRSRVRRRAGGSDIVIGGVGDAPEVEVVALLRRSLIPLLLEASELPEQSEHPANQRPFRHRDGNARRRLHASRAASQPTFALAAISARGLVRERKEPCISKSREFRQAAGGQGAAEVCWGRTCFVSR